MLSIYHTLIWVHVFVCIGLLFFVIFQKTSGEGLLASGNKTNFMSGDEVASFLTKVTLVFAIVFIANTIALASIGSKISKSMILISTENSSKNKV